MPRPPEVKRQLPQPTDPLRQRRRIVYHRRCCNHMNPSAAQPQPKLGLSPAKTQRSQRSENNGEKFSKIIYLFPPNLACFAPWRESIPRVRVFQITGKFARAAQTVSHSNPEHNCPDRQQASPLSVLSMPWLRSPIDIYLRRIHRQN